MRKINLNYFLYEKKPENNKTMLALDDISAPELTVTDALNNQGAANHGQNTQTLPPVNLLSVSPASMKSLLKSTFYF